MYFINLLISVEWITDHIGWWQCSLPTVGELQKQKRESTYCFSCFPFVFLHCMHTLAYGTMNCLDEFTYEFWVKLSFFYSPSDWSTNMLTCFVLSLFVNPVNCKSNTRGFCFPQSIFLEFLKFLFNSFLKIDLWVGFSLGFLCNCDCVLGHKLMPQGKKYL